MITVKGIPGARVPANVVGGAVELPLTPGAGQAGKVLRWNQADQAFEFVTAGGSDHMALSNLLWTGSGHQAAGGLLQVAGFDGGDDPVLVLRAQAKANSALVQADSAGRLGPDWYLQEGTPRAIRVQMRAIFDATFATQFGNAASRQGTSWANVTDADGYWTRSSPISGNGNLAGLRSGANNDAHLGLDWSCAGRIRLPTDITSQRVFVGICAGNPANLDDQAVRCAYLRYSTAAGDTNWQVATDDGTTQDLDDSGVAVAAGAVVDFALYMRSGTLYWRIGTTSGSKTANVPSGSFMAGMHANIWNIGAVARSIDVDALACCSYRPDP